MVVDLEWRKRLARQRPAPEYMRLEPKGEAWAFVEGLLARELWRR